MATFHLLIDTMDVDVDMDVDVPGHQYLMAGVVMCRRCLQNVVNEQVLSICYWLVPGDIK